jgi:glycosyltransferase involved in cell wall biosynthesis
MKVILITGSYPPDVCGTADYSAQLERYLGEAGVAVEVFSGKRWTVQNAPALVRHIDQLEPDIVHMQYPTTGYGWKLGPQVMGLLQPMVLTLHEASQGHVLRQLSLYPFTLRSKKIIFTNEYEQTFVQHIAPWIKTRSTLIPIGSNILPTSFLGARTARVITYFGLIRPEKGLEQVIELGYLLKQQSQDWRIRIVGIVMPGWEGYFQKLRAQSTNLSIEWELGLEGDALSKMLASTDIAYVPFPDGASERRSSLIALLTLGAAIVTTNGPHTPAAMKKAVLFATSPAEAVSHVEDLVSNVAQKNLLQLRARTYAARFAWDRIAADHIAIYEDVLRREKH